MDGENNSGTLEQAERQDQIRDLPDDQRLNTPGTGNKLVADKSDNGEVDPFAYRNKGENAKRRADYMERVLIDHFAGGDTRRWDEQAGVDFNA